MILPASASQGLGFQTCTTTHRLNSSCICTFLNIVQTLITEETFTQFNVFICVFKEKLSPQDQMNRHLTRPPPDYKDQRRNSGSLQSAAQYSGESSSKQIQIIAVEKKKTIKNLFHFSCFLHHLGYYICSTLLLSPTEHRTQTTRRTWPRGSRCNPSAQRRRRAGTFSTACAT